LIASQPLGEGVPQHVLDLLSELNRERFEVRVACPRASTLWKALDREGGVLLHDLTAARGPAWTDVRSLLTLVRLVRSADLVHAHSAKAGFLARLAALVTRRTRRVIFTPHAWSFWAADGVAAGGYRALERVTARWCRKILVVSAAEREAGLAAHIGTAGQYRVVPNGVRLERFALPRRPVGGRVVSVGRLAPQKRPDLLVRAAASLRDRGTSFQLHLVGDGPERPRVQALVDELGLADQVVLLGNRSDIPELLAEAACFALASDYEGCPISILEAMAAGVPVVATHVGGVPELVEDGRTGRLVRPGDADALATAVAELLADDELLRRFGEEARRVATERFSTTRMAVEIQGVYAEVLGEAQ
jgi:glycosyltransferase involved in cell wall biosynthesis